jgi:hypothetical protein
MGTGATKEWEYTRSSLDGLHGFVVLSLFLVLGLVGRSEAQTHEDE